MATKRKAEAAKPADWSDDNEETTMGPVDDLAPIGALSPVTEAEEEPTLLGPYEPHGVASTIVDARREAFVDAAAIAIYASGWPLKNAFARAEQLWAEKQKARRS